MKNALLFVMLASISVSLFAGCSSTTSSGLPSDAPADDHGSVAAEQAPQPAASSEELAFTAYASFLSGDRTILADAQSETWWIPDFQDGDMAYAYTYLDLDGDGIVELLIQMEDAPDGYNGVFHFESGRSSAGTAMGRK